MLERSSSLQRALLHAVRMREHRHRALRQ